MKFYAGPLCFLINLVANEQSDIIVLKVKIYANGQILFPNCGVLDCVSVQVRETEK